MGYKIRGNKHIARIGDKDILVDSDLEERVLRWLEINNYSYSRSDVGVSYWGSNYTPDVLLSVLYKNETYGAIVEIKPAKSFMTPYILRRMCKAGSKYSNLLLLYAEKENMWYRINPKTYEFTEFGVPVHGRIPIEGIYSPWSTAAKSVYYHKYKKPVEPVKRVIEFSLDVATDIAKALFAPPKSTTRYGRHYKKRKR
jgi:hypothetical protein